MYKTVNKDSEFWKYDCLSFDVDSKTMLRNDSSDTFPPFISIEK